MRFGGWIFALALFAGCALWSKAYSSELISRPIFTADRKFGVATDESATRLTDSSMPLELWVYDRALKSCELDQARVRGKLSEILDENSSLWSSLDNLFPNSRNKLAQLNIRVVVDDFTDFAGKSAAFSSYFTDLDGPTIGLDCQPVERSYWLRSLAHEITHALLYQHDVQSGFEEGLAQLIEHIAGGEQPELTLKHLKSARVLPTVLEDRRPLPSRESYAIHYLFVSYIRQEFGGWPTLRAMTGTDPDLWPQNQSPICSASDGNSDFLAQATCRARALLAATDPGSFAFEKMTREGLLRYFYMALSMNNPKSSHYQILEWDGFSDLPARPAIKKPVPGQAIIFKSGSAVKTLSRELEIYCVKLLSDQNFQIVPITQSVSRSLENPDSYKYCLAINIEK